MPAPSDVDGFFRPLDYPMYVVTAAGGGERDGCLVGFTTQCGIDPPRFLACLSTANRTYRIARSARLLAVHLLGAGQHELAALFGQQTGDETDKLAQCDWQPGPDGVPLLADCPHRFVGEILDRVDLGDHHGFLLRPTEVAAALTGPPLMFSAVQDLEPGHPA
ncbi:MAG TPA: flavin reductase family protein [Mycobacteriales bacterium]|nr:flavin reductase family protein [Mycobacteriales bacterium]